MAFEHNPVLNIIKEVKLTTDADEIISLFESGCWVMIDATEQDKQLKALMGRYK